MKRLLLILGFVLAIISCEKNTVSDNQDELINTNDTSSSIKQYFYVGHAYKSRTRVDDRLVNFDFSKYDQIWLGGDMCSATTEFQSTVQHLDDVFNLSSPNTHWSLGNHDSRNGNINWITEATGRPTFYATYFDGITLLVLNTNFTPWGIYDTVQVNQQYNLIQQVCDTINESSHLIVLTHNVVWGNIDGLTNVMDYANTNLSSLLFSINPNLTYIDGVYPLLVEVKRRGIEVIHISGDLGQKNSHYTYLTDNCIQFIGSGITSNTEYNEQFPSAGQTDLFLVLSHNLEKRRISFSFYELN